MNTMQPEIYQRSSRDNKIAGLILSIVAIIVLYWIGTGIVKLYEWIASLGPYQSWWWTEIGRFLWRNFSVVFIIYTMICLQSAGVAEFKFGKSFVKAFGLSLLISPPLMIVLYAKPHRLKRSKTEEGNNEH